MRTIIIIIGLFFTFGTVLQAGAADIFTPLTLGDQTTENVQLGNDPVVEDLDRFFREAGITNPDGSEISINDPDQQLQHQLFQATSAGTIDVEYLGVQYTAAQSTPFGVFDYDPVTTAVTYRDPLFIQDQTAAGSIFSFDVTENSYFGFYLFNTRYAKYLTTVNDANVDGRDHAVMYATNIGYTLAFEDKPYGMKGPGYNGVDWDYEDLVVNVTTSETPVVPEPVSCILFLTGGAALGLRSFFGNSRVRLRSSL